MHKDKQQIETQEREKHEQDTMKKSSPEDMSGAKRSQEKNKSDVGGGVTAGSSHDAEGKAFNSDNSSWKNEENKRSDGKQGSRGGNAGSGGGLNKGQSGNMGNKDRRSGL